METKSNGVLPVGTYQMNGQSATLPTAELVVMTPIMAAALMKRNVTNRPIRERQVRKFALDMINDNWTVGTSGIGVDKNGDLADGQHRLLACIEANVAFTTWVFYGLEPEARDNIDTGAKRQLGDVLKMKGESYSTNLASTIHLGWRWDQGAPMGNDRPSTSEALAWLNRNGGIRGSMAAGMAMHRVLGISAPATSLFHHRTSVHAEERDLFMEEVEKGYMLKEGAPALALRGWAVRARQKRYQNIRGGMYLALYIKAWNAWLEGRQLKTMTFRTAGRRESFPELLGIDGLPIDWEGRHDLELVDMPIA
jgi:hypothetical protein